ncbi:MAG TPA: asparagine synthase-related protein, partial [Candidatus Nitrosotenuis sp.]|nr:asparagine synthase-related protein [Candidatus Nitrosotenuis sp.]
MRVLVAMSGGVDSSVAAALMVEAGHEVIGVTMTLSPAESRVGPAARGCCSVWDVGDAERVAWKLGIPHYVFNLRQEFEEHVIANFLEEYRR